MLKDIIGLCILTTENLNDIPRTSPRPEKRRRLYVMRFARDKPSTAAETKLTYNGSHLKNTIPHPTGMKPGILSNVIQTIKSAMISLLKTIEAIPFSFPSPFSFIVLYLIKIKNTLP